MKRIIKGFFMTLGVIFFILILIGMYLFITDPYNLKPILFGDSAAGIESGTQDKNSALSAEQEAALERFGVDPADVPSEISPEQEECFEAELGEERVAEIKAGDSPTMLEYNSARNCI